jgi:hypothetical protein
VRSLRKRWATRVKETTMATNTITAFEVQPFRIDVPEGAPVAVKRAITQEATQ